MYIFLIFFFSLYSPPEWQNPHDGMLLIKTKSDILTRIRHMKIHENSIEIIKLE